MEEVLGGLEDGEEDAPVFASAEDDEYHLFDRGEVSFIPLVTQFAANPSFFCTDPSDIALQLLLLFHSMI